MENDRRAGIAELVATFTLTFIGCSAVISTVSYGGSAAGTVAIALAHGLALGIMVSATAHISGGHVNPAITIGLWVTGKIKSQRAVIYIVAQLAGALLAAYLVKVIFPGVGYDQASGGAAKLLANPDFSIGKAILAEAIATFLLAFTVFAVAVDGRANTTVGGLLIGLVIAFDILAIGPLTGAAMNPARWFGPAIASGSMDNWYVWIIGPVAGAVLASVMYWTVFLKDKEKVAA